MTDYRYRAPFFQGVDVPLECRVVEKGEVNEWLCHKVLELKVSALSRQLELPHKSVQYKYPGTKGRLPQGTIAHSLDLSDLEALETETAKFKRESDTGCTYVTLYGESDKLNLVGFAAMQRTYEPSNSENIHIKELYSSKQRHGIGSAVLHAALKQAEGSAVSSMTIDTITNSGVNWWFHSLGFTRPVRSEVYNAVQLGNFPIPLTTLEVPYCRNVSRVLMALEDRKSWLANAKEI